MYYMNHRYAMEFNDPRLYTCSLLRCMVIITDVFVHVCIFVMRVMFVCMCVRNFACIHMCICVYVCMHVHQVRSLGRTRRVLNSVIH